MANKYINDKGFPRNERKYCHHASRGYRQNRESSIGKQQISENSSNAHPDYSHFNNDLGSSPNNEKKCEYLKYPLPTTKESQVNNSTAMSPHHCQVVVNTPRYYKQKPHRHPSALSIPLLSRPESKIHLKARSRTKLNEDSSKRERKKRTKTRPLSKHQIHEQQALMNKDYGSSCDGASDGDDLRSVSLRAYSSGCLSVDISNQVGDLVKAFDTVSKKHKVKKIVYEEIEPVYPKCELQQLTPRKKRSQRKLKKHQMKSQQRYCDPDLLELPENEEDLENQCTCSHKGDSDLKDKIEPKKEETKNVNRLEELFFEVFAQGKADGLSKQKKLDCLKDAYNQYSAALEDFSNAQNNYSEDYSLQKFPIQPNYIQRESNVESENYNQGHKPQQIVNRNLEFGRGHRQGQYRGEGFNHQTGIDKFNYISNANDMSDKQEPIENMNKKMMHCTCNNRTDNAYTTQPINHGQNVHNYLCLPQTQMDNCQEFNDENQRNESCNVMDSTESNIEEAIPLERAENVNYQTQQVTGHLRGNNNTFKSCQTCSKGVKQMNKKCSNRDQTAESSDLVVPTIKELPAMSPNTGFIESTQCRRLSIHSEEQNENIMNPKPPPVAACPAPPKMSVSDDHFLSDGRHHYCGHVQCYQRSKSKGVEIANMEKRQTAQNLLNNQESPITYNDFPSEVPDMNRSNTQVPVDGYLLQPRKPTNHDAENRDPSSNNTPFDETKSIENLTQNRSNVCFPVSENIDINPFLNFLLQNNTNYNMPNIVPEEQSVYFCNVSHNLQQLTNFELDNQELCDDQGRSTEKQEVIQGHQNMSKQISSQNPKFGMIDLKEQKKSGIEDKRKSWNFGNLDSRSNVIQNYYNTNDSSKEAVDACMCLSEEIGDNLEARSKKNINFKTSDDQMSKTCSDQSSYKNYIESIIDNSTDFMANKGVSPSVQGSKCQSNLKLETETNTDLKIDDSSSQMDSKLSQEITQRLTDRLVHSEKTISPASLVTLDEPEYLQHLKKLRWDHLRHISREVHRLENLERFLDTCGCGHMMINRGLT